MHQLVQLQENIEQFHEQNCQIVTVFREEKDGDGLTKTMTRTGATFPLVVDTPATATKAYSPDGFHTYIVGPETTILADLPGTKMKRPSPEKIFATLKTAEATRYGDTLADSHVH